MGLPELNQGEHFNLMNSTLPKIIETITTIPTIWTTIPTIIRTTKPTTIPVIIPTTKPTIITYNYNSYY